MKIFNLSVLLISLFSVFVSAQDKTQGQIFFKQKINIHASLPEEYEAMKAMIPEFSESDVVVTFKNQKSKIKAKENASSSSASGGAQVSMSMGSSAVEYADFTKNIFYRTLSIDGENYHTEMPIEKTKVKLLKGTKKVCGYTCKMASFTSDKEKYIIYYTTAIKGQFSPMPGVFVDGVILRIDNNKLSYLASKVDFVKIDEKAVSIASNSEKITEQQLMDLEEELLEEAMPKGGGNVKVIKTSN